MKLNIAYFGTPDFSAHVLEKIITDRELKELVNVSTVITQPDKPVGRKKLLTPSPVKNIANKYEIKIFEYSNLFGASNLEFRICDLALVFAYGHIIPKEILSIPKYGFWNIHPSLLPKFRGASPIAYPLALGETETGVSLIQMDEKMDHGPIISQVKTTIQSHETRKDLEMKFAGVGFEMVKNQLLYTLKRLPRSLRSLAMTPLRQSYVRGKHPLRQSYVRGKHPLRQSYVRGKHPLRPPFAKTTKVTQQGYAGQARPQSHANATFTRLLKKDDGFIPWHAIQKAMNNELITISDLPPFLREYIEKYVTKEQCDFLIVNCKLLIVNLYRALFPWPGLWTVINVHGQEKRMKLTDVKLENNQLAIKKIQLEGKTETEYVHIPKML